MHERWCRINLLLCVLPGRTNLTGAFPNSKNVALHRPTWNILVVRDAVPPPEVSPEFQELVSVGATRAD